MWTVPSLDDEGEVVFPIGAYFTSVASAMRFYNLVNLRPDTIFSNSAGLYVRFFQGPSDNHNKQFVKQIYVFLSVMISCVLLRLLPPFGYAVAVFVKVFIVTILHIAPNLT